MVRLPEGEKISKIFLFVLTECTNVTDGRTHRRTAHDGIRRAYASSRGRRTLIVNTLHNACTSAKAWTIFLDSLSHESVTLNPLLGTGNYSATSKNMKLVGWPLIGVLLHLVQR